MSPAVSSGVPPIAAQQGRLQVGDQQIIRNFLLRQSKHGIVHVPYRGLYHDLSP